MTAVHDVEFMEYCLLKTLEEFIRSNEPLISKFDRNGKPFYQLKIHKQKYGTIWEDIKIEKEKLAQIEIVRRTEQPYCYNRDSDNILTIWLVICSKSQEIYLATTSYKKLSDHDFQTIKGLLGIYRNFYEVLSILLLDRHIGVIKAVVNTVAMQLQERHHFWLRYLKKKKLPLLLIRTGHAQSQTTCR